MAIWPSRHQRKASNLDWMQMGSPLTERSSSSGALQGNLTSVSMVALPPIVGASAEPERGSRRASSGHYRVRASHPTLTPSMAQIADRDVVVDLRGFPNPAAFKVGGRQGNVVTKSSTNSVHRGWRLVAVDGKRYMPSDIATALTSAQKKGRYSVTFRIGEAEEDDDAFDHMAAAAAAARQAAIAKVAAAAQEEAERLRRQEEERKRRQQEELEAEKKRIADQERRMAEQRRKEEEEKQRLAEEARIQAELEAERKRREAEEEERKRKEAAELERQRLEAELQEQERKRKELEEADRRQKEEAERLHIEAEEAQRKQREAEEERLRREAEEAERNRREAEEAERRRREAEEAERKQKEAEAERKRGEAERERREAEEADRRHREAEEAERKQREAEAERKRRKAEEAEARRREAEEMARRQRESAELERKRREAEEAKRKQQEAEAMRARREAEELERKRREAEAEEQRRQAEADRLRREEEELARLQAENAVVRRAAEKQLQRATGLPPRDKVKEPQKAMLSAMMAQPAKPPAKPNGPCDKCDGKHDTDACPFFKKARDKHADAWANYGSKGSESASSQWPVLRRARVVPQPGDGSCLFHSLSHGLRGTNASRLRAEIAEYIAKNPNTTVASNPIKDWVLWDTGMDTSSYASRMRTGSQWGGAVELAVCAKMRSVHVHVYERGQGGFKRISSFEGDTGSGAPVVSLLYGGRVHYDALEV